MWVDEPPTNAWLLSGDIENDHPFNLDVLLKLYSKKIDISLPHKHVTSMALVTHGSLGEIPWSYVMPAKEHRTFVNNLVNKAVEAINDLPKDYYIDTWKAGGQVLSSLRQAAIDVPTWSEIMEQRPGNVHVVETFMPDKKGFASKVKYNRFGTRTGRLTVESGPNILTLKREFRKKLIKSSSPEGSIISIDFAALEARVLLYEAGGRCEDPDLYSFIARDVFHGSANRQQVKGAVISEVYGSSKHALGEALGISGPDLDDFVMKVRVFFKINDLKKRVKDQFIKNGWITNRYNRRVLIDDPMDHIFVNYYAQSTGTDVVMLGFRDLLTRLRKLPGVRPLYVLHDALIIDCPKEHVDTVMKFDTVKVKGYVQKFFVKPEIVSCTQ